MIPQWYYFTRSLGYVLKMRSSARANGFVWKYSPLLACCNGNLFRHASMTIAAVIPYKGTLDDCTPSLLPFPIDDSGLRTPVSPERDNVVYWKTKRKINNDLLFPLTLPLILPFLLSGARTRILPSRLPTSMMASSPLNTSSPFSFPLLPSGARALSLRARVRLNRLLLHPFLARHTRPLGRIPFPFLPSPLPSFLHLLLICLLSLRVFLFLPPPSHPCLRFLRHFTLFFFTFVKSHNVLCHVLS